MRKTGCMKSSRSPFALFVFFVKLLHSRLPVRNLMLAHLIIKFLQLRIAIVFIKSNTSDSTQSHFSPFTSSFLSSFGVDMKRNTKNK
jgi:hypothetical protein